MARPEAVFDHLSAGTRTVSVQAGERGPFSHAIAGIDIALWDWQPRRAGQPLRRYLGGAGSRRVPVYASGIGPEDALVHSLEARAAGHRAFKLKVGFGRDVDLANLASLRQGLGGDTVIAVDANQAWSRGGGRAQLPGPGAYSPVWLEEPIGAGSRRR